SEQEEGFVYYKLRASTADSSEVAEVKEGNFFLTVASRPALAISDYKLVFEEDTSLETPYGFLHTAPSELAAISQTHVNQVPCAMSALAFPGLKRETFFTLIGFSADKGIVSDFSRKVDIAFLERKEGENRLLHEQLMDAVCTKTAEPLLDAYFRQCYLDNVLRGGKPLLFPTADGPVGYHIYSRKHGDLERDYNFFTLEPSFYSQGNGNFRDVLQNRRNDVFFEPRLGDANITQFASFLQADGYNPLSIEGIRFSFAGDRESLPSVLKVLPLTSFTPGMVATALHREGIPVEPTLSNLIAQSRVEFKASYGEGYWEDHFTYFLDLIETYLAVYPDGEEALLFDKNHPFFRSPVTVRPRSEKVVIRKDGSLRQYGSLHHRQGDHGGWHQGTEGLLKANLAGKLLVLVLNKYGHLDPEGIGLSYEADRPGWNDAMNGLPGLFGSGVSEAIELRKLAAYLLESLRRFSERNVLLPDLAVRLATDLENIPTQGLPFRLWDERMNALESYRARLEAEIPATVAVSARCFLPLLETIVKTLDQGIERAKSLGPILPTYLTYEALTYLPILDSEGKPKIGDYGLPLAQATAFTL
ncbi:MAG TPA: hypothetical protein P5154_07875, partial [Candidatus Izemoplasmatales bacterium]|nr:hypothetical protein [Candidatus Izemoplasmatales bacterium]